MEDSDFELLMTSIEQAGRIKRGEMEPARKFEVRAEDVKAIRAKLNKSQAGFALIPSQLLQASTACSTNSYNSSQETEHIRRPRHERRQGSRK